MTKTKREFTGEMFVYVYSFNIITMTKMEPADKKLGWITIMKTQAMVMKMVAMATTVWSAEMARAMEVAV